MKPQAKRYITFLLALILVLTGLPVLALPMDAGAEELGNLPINSLNGGVMLQADCGFYWADSSGIFLDGIPLVEEAGRNLNLIRGGLYYTLGERETAIRRYDLAEGTLSTLLTWEAPIDQLFITGGGMILFLSQGRVYRGDMGDLASIQADETPFSVSRFIPTPHGTIYAAGFLGDYTIYAGNRRIEAGITLFFTEADYLIIRRGTADYQIPIAALFSGASIEPVPYALHAEQISLLSEPQEEGCPICEAAFFAEEEEEIVPLVIAASAPTHTLPLTVSQENVVLRARQQLEIRWTPLADIIGWRGNTIYRAGVTYRGIPYAQPVSRGAYIPWNASLSTFAAAVRDPNSVMYTSFSYHGTHATRAPFFGADCSSFVSWSLQQPHRTHTGTFPNHAHRIAQNINAVQVGDVFNSTGHNLIVTRVEYHQNGNLAAVEIMEQTIPLPQHRRFGVAGNTGATQAGSLQTLIDRTFGRGFALYRSNTINNVTFTPDPAVDVGLGPRHIVTATAGSGGLISPAGPIAVPRGENVTFTFHPNPGFAVRRVLVDGASVGAPASHTLTNVRADATIRVEFELTGSPFADVRERDWFHGAVVYVFDQNLITGTSSTHFSPNVTATRGMFVTILGRMEGINHRDWYFPGTVTGSHVNFRTGPGTNHSTMGTLPRDTRVGVYGRSGDWYKIHHGGRSGYMHSDFLTAHRRTFSDVRAGNFFAPYVEWANANNIVNGMGDGSFRPNQVITREEVATALFRYINASGITLERDRTIPPFADIDSVASWARDAVTVLQQAGLIQGMGDNRFAPREATNRAQMASIIADFHRQHG